MKRSFLHAAYREDNADLAEQFDPDDSSALQNHFNRYGRHEMRGVQSEECARIEGVLVSDSGQAFIVGWADRRLLVDFVLTFDLGYVRQEFSADDLIWFQRDDVSAVIGSDVSPSGFMALVSLTDPVPHGHVTVSVSGAKLFEDPHLWPLSSERFFLDALSASAVLADRPIGETFDQGRRLLPLYQDLWQSILADRKYVKAFRNDTGRNIARSIIIVLHRKADMLLTQLTLLGPFLENSDTEVIVVGNPLEGAKHVVTTLSGFSLLHDIDLTLYLCSGNAGFSAANNFGASLARGDVLIFMNPDIFPPETQQTQAFRFLETDPGAELQGALLYYGDGLLMHSGMYTTSDAMFDARTGDTFNALRVEHFGKGLIHHNKEELPLQVTACNDHPMLLASAALWKIRKSVFEDAGCLDESYLMAYYEDADFCLSLKANNVPITVDTQARFIHLEGVGSTKPPHLRTAMWLNRCMFSERFADSPYIADGALDRVAL